MKRGIIGTVLVFMSVLTAVYSPMMTYAQSQSASSSQLAKLKETATKELDRRISKYRETLKSLDVDTVFGQLKEIGSQSTSDQTAKNCSDDSADGQASKDSGISFSASSSDINVTIALPCGLEDKTRSFLEKIVGQLEQLKEKVGSVTSLGDMQALGKNIDSQFGLDQLADAQASVTQAIESMTGTLASLKSVSGQLKDQASYVKGCFDDVTGGQAAGCDKLSGNSRDVADQLQSKLGDTSSIMSTIQSILTSSIALLMALVSQFTSLTGGLGSLDSLSNIANLGNLSDVSKLGDITKMSDSLGGGNVTGLLGSFTSILSQIATLGSQAQMLFSSLSSLSKSSGISTVLDSMGLGQAGDYLDTAAQASGQVSTVAGGISDITSSLEGFGGIGSGSNTGTGGTTTSPKPSTSPSPATKDADFTSARGASPFHESKRGTNCTIDYSRIPSLATSAQAMLRLCDSSIKKIETLLSPRGYNGPVQLMYIASSFPGDSYVRKDICADGKYVALAYPEIGRVIVCGPIFTQYPDSGFESAVIHEVAHLTQKYGRGMDGIKIAPLWVTEGIAQYATHELGFSKVGELVTLGCTTESVQTYLENNGYGCATALLTYIERVYSPGLIKNIHAVSNSTKGFTNSLITKGTGKTIEQLYGECLKAECKGGKAL